MYSRHFPYDTFSEKWYLTASLLADNRLQVDRLYLTFPNPILLEYSNERYAEAEILRAGPLAR